MYSKIKFNKSIIHTVCLSVLGIFSSTMYSQSVEVTPNSIVNEDTTVNQSKNKEEDEIVVVGYGIQKKKNITGAVLQVESKDFNSGVIVSPEQLIQGKTPGVQITMSDGSPNSAPVIRIRGNSAIRAGAEPLYIVDGIFMDGGSPKPSLDFTAAIGGSALAVNPMAFINPNDIASIDILKDASATAIYGSRGSNGVVLITTKKGKKSSPLIEVSTSSGVSIISKRIGVANGDQYRAMLTDYAAKGLINPVTAKAGNYGENEDALGAILRTGKSQNYNISMNMGGDKSNIYASFGYQKTEGIIRKTALEKFNIAINGSLKFLDKKTLGIDFGIIANQSNDQSAPISNKSSSQGSLIAQALQWNPTLSLTGSTENREGYSKNIDGDIINPLAFSDAYDDYTKTNTVIASIIPYLQILPGLIFKTQLSTTQSVATRRSQIKNSVNIVGVKPTTGNSGGIASSGSNEYKTYQITNTLNYTNNTLFDKLDFGVLLGFEYYNSEKRGNSISGRNFINNGVDYYDMLAYSNAADRGISSYYDPTIELQSYFGRLNLNYNSRYSLTATLRADGSSKFGINNKYGFFPSVGFAWNIDQENFLKDVRAISFLKFRTSWGITGNQSFPPGASQIRYTPTAANTLTQNNLANPNLKWQTDKQFNIGFDMGFLDNIITGTVEYFNKQTNNLLISLPAAAPAPGINVWKNLENGIITNQGIEMAINANILRKKTGFNWTLGANVTFIQNKVTGLNGQINTGEINGPGVSGAFIQQMVNDYALNEFLLRKFNGIDANGFAIVDENPTLGSGNPNPTSLVGFNTTVTYKFLPTRFVSLSTNFNGAYGYYIYNNTANTVISVSGFGDKNISTGILNSGENPANRITTSTRYLEKGDFLRMTNLNLSYSHGSIGSIIKNLVVFFTIQNVFVLTSFTGFDPEVNIDKSISDVPSFGIEYTPYPAARTFVGGIKISL